MLLLALLITGTVSTTVSGRAISRTGRYKRFPLLGLAIMAVGLLALSTLDAHTRTATIAALLAFFGLGFGLVSQVLTVAIQNAVDRRDLGIATASANLFRSLGGAIGIADFGAALHAAEHLPVRRAGRDRRRCWSCCCWKRCRCAGRWRRDELRHRRSCCAARSPAATWRSSRTGRAPHWAGPPLHQHDFDEAFYVLEGELTFQVEDAVVVKRAGEFAFAPRNVVAHARQPQRRAGALRARDHARGLRALLRADGRRPARVGAAAVPGDDRGRPADTVRAMSARRAIFIAPFDELSEPALRGRARRARRGARMGWLLPLGPHRLPRPGAGARRPVDHARRDRRRARRRSSLGPLVTPLARRRTHQLARETATLDRLSGGRLVLGVGLGGNGCGEFDPERFGEEPRHQGAREAARRRARRGCGVLGGRVRAAPGERHDPDLGRDPLAVPQAARSSARRATTGVFPIDQESPEALAELIAAVGPGKEIVVTNPAGTDPTPWEEAGATWCLTGFGPQPTYAEVERAIDAL